jgi:hypothetical protein
LPAKRDPVDTQDQRGRTGRPGAEGGMRIEHRVREAVDILRCIGPSAGPGEALTLCECVDELVRLGEPIVVVDLTRVGTLEDDFVAALRTCRARIARAGGLLKLALDASRREAVRRAGFDVVSDLHADEDRAMESFAPETETIGIP